MQFSNCSLNKNIYIQMAGCLPAVDSIFAVEASIFQLDKWIKIKNINIRVEGMSWKERRESVSRRNERGKHNKRMHESI